jgi:hypothetical protein
MGVPNPDSDLQKCWELKLIYENALWLGSVVSYGAIGTIQTLETVDDSSGPRTDILPRHINGTF